MDFLRTDISEIKRWSGTGKEIQEKRMPIHGCNLPHTETHRSPLINPWKKPCKLSACRAKLAVIKATAIFSLQEIAP